MNDLTPPEGSLSAGAMFGGTRIERELGRGGAGVVYVARDEALDRLVALKILHHAGLSEDAAAIARFRNEAQIAAKLEHPAIIPIYATGLERGMTFMTMRYVPGRSLDQILNDDGPMSLEEALRLLRPIAAALDYAADHGIVHRDVKPGNILVDESVAPRRALLGDFGISRAYEGTRHTATGGWVGTPDYIAPEILKDDPATSRADQYSLACVLVELISGTSPFKRSNTAATITAQVTETPDLTVIPDLGTQTELAISVALEKNPDDRYATSSEFLTAVEHSVGRDSREAPVTIVRKRKRSKRTRHLKVAGGVVLSLIAIAAAGADLLDIRHAFLGDGSPAATPSKNSSSITRAKSGTASTDVLLLGSEFEVENAALDKTGETARIPKGSNGAEILKLTLQANPRTENLRVRTVPLTGAGTCDERVRAGLTEIPNRAIVLLDSECVNASIAGLNRIGEQLPPVYVLASGYLEDDAEPVLLTASAKQLAKAPAFATDWLHSLAKPNDATPYVRMRALSAFDMGEFAKRKGKKSCTLIEGANDPGSDLAPMVTAWSALTEFEVAQGLGSSDAVKMMAVDWGAMLDPNAPTLTGTVDGDWAVKRLASKQRGGCYILPGQTDVPDLLPWATKFVRAIAKADPDAMILGTGSPDSPRDTTSAWTPQAKRLFRELERHPNVWLHSSYPIAHPDSEGEKLQRGVRSQNLQGPNTFSDLESLFEVAMLIGVQSETGKRGYAALGHLEPQQWASGWQDMGFLPAWIRFDETERAYVGDVEFIYHREPGDRDATWEYNYAGPDDASS